MNFTNVLTTSQCKNEMMWSRVVVVVVELPQAVHRVLHPSYKSLGTASVTQAIPQQQQFNTSLVTVRGVEDTCKRREHTRREHTTRREQHMK
ncbi:hypothetical protein Pmani_005057 [Petrolisthes manimaculis]|uniref:Uncharacterized protein n=1 Tax=Petrolisthes manimaculis TaxID=1843537 RepID=A0AAE1UKV2_9EUCA|nr:hypothetical protein Pmani_005057 [Petrolisthes manimaculis]